MDEFAQTRGDDDLFDDEIIPVTSQVEYPEEPPAYPEEPEPSSPPIPAGPETNNAPPVSQEPQSVPQHQDAPTGQNKRRGNGRGRGGRGGGFNKGNRGTGAPGANTNQHNNTQPGSEATGGPEAQGNKEKETLPAENGNESEEGGATEPQEVPKPKVPAVRGDRSDTGGIKKPKLTEEELSERMAQVKITAAKRAAAHAAAEADEASFKERERIASAKRAEERKIHRALAGEREKNRQRKLKAQTGREWDAEKSPDALADAAGRGASAYRRGMHGGVAYNRSSPPAHEGENYHPRNEEFRGGLGRGGRGGGRGPPGGSRGGRGRGRGRGGMQQLDGANESSPTRQKAPTKPPAIEAVSEFPALPSSEKENANNNKTDKTSPKPSPSPKAAAPSVQKPLQNTSADITFSPTALQGSWADHEDSIQAEKEKKSSAQEAK